MKEKEFLAQVIASAKSRGWLVYHTYDSRLSEPGFPDLVLVRGDRIIFAELKVGKNKLRPPQKNWLNLLRTAQQVKVFLWRPEHWNHIVKELEDEEVV